MDEKRTTDLCGAPFLPDLVEVSESGHLTEDGRYRVVWVDAGSGPGFEVLVPADRTGEVKHG